MAVQERRFAHQQELAVALAAEVATNLRNGIKRGGLASLVVSGGHSAIRFFHALSVEELDWSKVQITLADECWVDVQSEHSNERLVREHLLRERAATAVFVGLKLADTKPISAVVEIISRLENMPRPFDAVVLGMGADGHTAALFPGMAALTAMLNPRWAVQVGPATAPVAPKERVSLTLRALLDARHVYLSIAGEDKMEVYEAALEGDMSYPVASVLRQKIAPVTAYLVGNSALS